MRRYFLNLCVAFSVTTFVRAEQCQITSPLPVPVLLTGCTYSGTLPNNSTSYIQNTLAPTTTTQAYSVQTASVTDSMTMKYLASSAAQCMQADATGHISGTGAACGSGGGGGGGATGTINAANQFSLPYYSLVGSSNVLSGYNGATVSTNTGVNISTLTVQSSMTVISPFRIAYSTNNIDLSGFDTYPLLVSSNSLVMPAQFSDLVYYQGRGSVYGSALVMNGSPDIISYDDMLDIAGTTSAGAIVHGLQSRMTCTNGTVGCYPNGGSFAATTDLASQFGAGVRGQCFGPGTCRGGFFNAAGSGTNYAIYTTGGQVQIESSMTVTGFGGISVTKGVVASSATLQQLNVSSNTVLAGTTFYQNGNATIGTASSLILVPSLTAGNVVQADTGGQLITGAVSLNSQVTNVLSKTNGGTGLSAANDDEVMIGNGSTWQSKAVPNCTDTGGNHLNYTIATNSLSCGTSGGSSFSLAVGTGTSGGSNFAEPLTSTSASRGIVIFDSTTFSTAFAGGATTYVNHKFTATQPIVWTPTTGAFSATGISISTGLTGNTFSQSSFTITNDVKLGGTAFAVTIASNAFIAGTTFYQGGNASFNTASFPALSASLPLQLDSAKNVTAAAIDLSGTQATGTMAAARMPALTGDVTTSAGAVATTAANTQGNIKTFTSSVTFTNANGISSYFGVATGSLTVVNSSSSYSITVATSSSANYQFAVSSIPAIAPGDFLLTVSSTGGTMAFAVQNNGHVVSSGTVPTLSSCGTSPTIYGTDIAGTVTAGATSSGCTLTFAAPYAIDPPCIVTPQAGSLTNTFSYTHSATQIVVTETAFGTGKFDYHCWAGPRL